MEARSSNASEVRVITELKAILYGCGCCGAARQAAKNEGAKAMRLLVEKVDYSFGDERGKIKIVCRTEDLFREWETYDIWVYVSDQAVSPEWYQKFEEISRFYKETGRHVSVPTVMQYPGDWRLVVSHREVSDVLSNGGFTNLEPERALLRKMADKYWAVAEALLFAHLSIDDREATAKARTKAKAKSL